MKQVVILDYLWLPFFDNAIFIVADFLSEKRAINLRSFRVKFADLLYVVVGDYEVIAFENAACIIRFNCRVPLL